MGAMCARAAMSLFYWAIADAVVVVVVVGRLVVSYSQAVGFGRRDFDRWRQRCRRSSVGRRVRRAGLISLHAAAAAASSVSLAGWAVWSADRDDAATQTAPALSRLVDFCAASGATRPGEIESPRWRRCVRRRRPRRAARQVPLARRRDD